MKKLLTIGWLSMLCVITMAQVQYQVSGICPAEARQIFVYDLSDHFQLLDSTAVSNGHFSITGKADADALLGLGNNL